jgi:hypothetical protein
MNLDSQKRQQLNKLFALNRRVMKAYLLKESLERLWTCHYEGAMLRYLQSVQRVSQLSLKWEDIDFRRSKDCPFVRALQKGIGPLEEIVWTRILPIRVP